MEENDYIGIVGIVRFCSNANNRKDDKQKGGEKRKNNTNIEKHFFVKI